MTRISYKNLAVKKTRNGLGIFAGATFHQGQTIFHIDGARKRYTTLLRRGGTFLDNCFRISENYYLSPEGYIGVYLNHSCDPNAKVVKEGRRLFVRAITKLVKGTEVLIDYATITARDDIWTMPCNCGSARCRKQVGNCNTLPKSVLTAYKKSGVLPPYIAQI
jgi:hypothetical protein